MSTSLLIGCDFSSSPSKRKPIVLALGQARQGRVQLQSLQTFDTLPAFGDWLAQPADWVGGFDLPFGLPRELVETLGWPTDWAACMDHYCTLERAQIREQFAAFCNARPVGGKFAHRATDGPAGSSPSMKWVNPPVAYMLHAGVPLLRQAGVPVLPNTAGCHSLQEAITTAEMAREVFETDWIKLELIGDDYTLQPDTLNLPEAASRLIKAGFKVLPYTTDDLVLCQRLVDVGCQAVMPWAAPIGTGKGPINPHALRTLRDRLDVPMIVDAGLGLPSHACQVLEWGFDAVLLNTAVALAQDPIGMAGAFADAVNAGRAAYRSGAMQAQDSAQPSTPVLGTPFWHQA